MPCSIRFHALKQIARKAVLFTKGGVSPGYDTLEIVYANGTTSTKKLMAIPFASSNYKFSSGQELFDEFCVPSTTSTGTEGNALRTRQQTPELAPVKAAPLQYYPPPVQRDPYSIVQGYYLNDTYSDTAVLFIPTFDTVTDPVTGKQLGDAARDDARTTSGKFLQQAKTDGKKKIIVDLTGNGGGTTPLGYDLFEIFFPTSNVYSETQYRTHRAFSLQVQALSTWDEDNTDGNTNQLTRHLGWKFQVLPDQSPTGWTEYGSFVGTSEPGLSAAVAQQNMSQEFVAISYQDPAIQGYDGVPLFFNERPFAPENILIVTDESCGSTCSIFVQLMIDVGGVVNSLLWGGLPVTEQDSSFVDAGQLVGGVRGAGKNSFDTLAGGGKQTLDYVGRRAADGKPTLSADEQQQYKSLMPIFTKDFPLKMSGGSVTLRNAYRKGSDIPLQFDHQRAGCRLYYTADLFLNPGHQWQEAAKAAWSGNGCKMSGVNGTSTQCGTPKNQAVQAVVSSWSIAGAALLM